MISEVATLVSAGWLLLAVAAWRRRVPLQNLLLAAGWILPGFALLYWILSRGDSPPARWPLPGIRSLMITLASLPLARLAAGWLGRQWRFHRDYGFGLNLLAALLTALPVGAAVAAELSAPTRRRVGPLWLGGIVAVWSLTLLLLTLPCWLDKRQTDPRRRLPEPFWPVLAWFGLTIWTLWGSPPAHAAASSLGPAWK